MSHLASTLWFSDMWAACHPYENHFENRKLCRAKRQTAADSICFSRSTWFHPSIGLFQHKPIPLLYIVAFTVGYLNCRTLPFNINTCYPDYPIIPFMVQIFIGMYVYIHTPTHTHIYIYIYLVQRKPNFLQDKNVNLVFSRVHCENIVFPEKTSCFPRMAK